MDPSKVKSKDRKGEGTGPLLAIMGICILLALFLGLRATRSMTAVETSRRLHIGTTGISLKGRPGGGSSTGQQAQQQGQNQADTDKQARQGADILVQTQQGDSTNVFKEDVSTWDYRCWAPKAGMSKPTLTLLSVVGGLKDSYIKAVRDNRLRYCARHRYRYCELYSMDHFRIPAWTKLPWMLALAPCTDYMIHLDADAMLYNYTISYGHLMSFMATSGIDQLLSQDTIIESPINYGVFMTRSTPWIWRFYKKLYNLCACDWGRTHDWPAEQGIIYDMLAVNTSSFETRHSKIIPLDSWNHIVGGSELPGPHDLVVHLTYPGIFPDGSPCKGKPFTKECKYIGLEHYMNAIVSKGHRMDADPARHFLVSNNSCQPVRTTRLFQGSGREGTYSNQNDAQSSSVLDFDVDPITGKVLGIKLGEVGCVGWRDKKCGLPQLWDPKKGTGPWMPWLDVQ